MIMSTSQALITIAVMALGTMATRFLPFILFPEGSRTPSFVKYLGKVLPSAVIGMLVVYCLKGVEIGIYPHGTPELIAVAITAALHFYKGHTLISIAAGTAAYMLLIQNVF